MAHAIIDGVRIDVGPHWYRYTDAERAEICNGVGSDDQPRWLAQLLAVLPYLYRASQPHDVDYYTGGTSRERLRADRRFRRNCLRGARHQFGPWWRRWLVPVHRAAWLLALAEINTAYAALRLAGRNAWNYTAMEEKGAENR